MALPPALRQTLAMVARVTAAADDDWWIIGSAAVALHGVAGLDVGDVDLLMSERDARGFLVAVGVAADPGPEDARFRSRVFGAWQAPPLTVEVMAGFRVRAEGGWVDVRPATRQAIDLDGSTMFVPSRRDLWSMLRLFGRPKDLLRADLLGEDLRD